MAEKVIRYFEEKLKQKVSPSLALIEECSRPIGVAWYDYVAVGFDGKDQTQEPGVEGPALENGRTSQA